MNGCLYEVFGGVNKIFREVILFMLGDVRVYYYIYIHILRLGNGCSLVQDNNPVPCQDYDQASLVYYNDVI